MKYSEISSSYCPTYEGGEGEGEEYIAILLRHVQLRVRDSAPDKKAERKVKNTSKWRLRMRFREGALEGALNYLAI